MKLTVIKVIKKKYKFVNIWWQIIGIRNEYEFCRSARRENSMTNQVRFILNEFHSFIFVAIKFIFIIYKFDLIFLQ